MVFKRKKKKQEHKFCPVCGLTLKVSDSYCIKCGYSFENRNNKSKKTKWRNIIIIVILVLGGYFGIRYSTGQTIFPRSLQDAISTFLPNR
jgi:predicted nucleic acid-binding Zn ribbon protein